MTSEELDAIVKLGEAAYFDESVKVSREQFAALITQAREALRLREEVERLRVDAERCAFIRGNALCRRAVIASLMESGVTFETSTAKFNSMLDQAMKATK